jgi:serine/threonine protein kinase
MGQVYRARDTKLGRDVAIKILPDYFVTDGERLARFEREARTLASLNHPNIAQIYGMEDASANGRALVMELVEGEDLWSFSPGARSRWPMPCPSRSRLRRRSRWPTSWAWCTAT